MPNIELYITKYFDFLQGKGWQFNTALGVLFAILFGIIDILTPPEYSFILLYLFPVSFTTWFAGRGAGLFISVACTAFWSRTHFQNNLPGTEWNVVSTLGIFFIVTLMLTKIRKMWETDRVLSRTDQLTGALNRRAFDHLVTYEILRHQREDCPFSLAYLDLDNFKEINDRYGHNEGDQLLKRVVTSIAEKLRKTDTIARIGGDEFAIFFPSTDHDSVKVVVQKVRDNLCSVSEGEVPITFSIGVLTCAKGCYDIETLVSLADKLMYEAKGAGKNNVRYVQYYQPE